jgi:hypothetical protein
MQAAAQALAGCGPQWARQARRTRPSPSSGPLSPTHQPHQTARLLPHPAPPLSQPPGPRPKAKYVAMAQDSKAKADAARAAAKAARPPPSVYVGYVQEVMPQLRAERPGVAVPDLMRAAAARWRALPEAEKAQRKRAADKARAAWAAAHPR